MKNSLQLANDFLYHSIKGRYLILEQIEVFLNTLHERFTIQEIGKSELGNKISSITFGHGTAQDFNMVSNAWQ